MTDLEPHLTEAQRQCAADRTLAPEERADAERHIAQCGSCAADVARLATLLARSHAVEVAAFPADDSWRVIRDRIERAKVVALPAADGARAASRARRSFIWIGVAAAAVGVFVLGRESATRGTPGSVATAATTGPGAGGAADSSTAYEEQARILFNRLTLERSLLRPEALAAIDRDLRVVDSAIAELDAAVARDPNNPVLRRLLASSYRQKVGILERIGNAE